MKLLPLACFAASSAQSGDYDYSVDPDRHYGYNSYGNYDDYGNKKNTWTYGGKAVGSNQSIARALNCWPANFDTDTLMQDDTTNSNPNENHEFGPLHVYGSEMRSKYGGGANANDPGLRAGLGGHYAYGHAHSSGTVNSAPSEWVHYHSARHAGCLYEIPDFTYNSNTWNMVFHLWYFNGYYSKANKANQINANNPTGSPAHVVYDANWVHFFNAHVLPSGGTGASTDPNLLQSATSSIKVVMANPQYEGLGWLNFVATYARSGVAVGSAYQEFADSTHVTEISPSVNAFDTYTPINDATGNTPPGTQEAQGITGNYYFDAWMGTWEMNMDTTMTWETSYDETNGSLMTGQGPSFSSFPHNELGKDFRFNMRILLSDANVAARKMYYFYKVNTITVTFPAPVAYSLVYDGREDNTASGATVDGGITNGGSGSAQGSGVYNVAQNNIRDNIVPPLDLGSHLDNSFGSHTPSTNMHHRIVGFLSTDATDACTTGGAGCADFCVTPSANCAITDNQCTASNLEEICSDVFHITGLMNTYSERLGGQRGTYQEIWVQLQYAMSLVTGNNAVDTDANEMISSPFPYLHFGAFQIASVVAGCDTVNVENGNTCNAFAAPGTHDFGWGG